MKNTGLYTCQIFIVLMVVVSTTSGYESRRLNRHLYTERFT